MERQDDKQIAGKLDSLDHLPEGYNPNLQSKWALLEEAINQPVTDRRKKAAIWWSIAAGLLLLMSITTLWLSMYKNGVQIPSQPGTIVLQNAAPSLGPENKNIEPLKLFRQKHFAKRRKTEAQAEPVNTPAVVIESHPAPPVSIQPPENKPEINNEVAVVAPVTKKAKGPRYVQVDFDAPSAPQSLFNQNNVAHSFQFRLFNIENNNSSSSVAQSFQNNMALKIKPGF